MQQETKALHLKIICTIYQLHFKDKWCTIDNEEDLDVVIPMYNFLKYSKNYRKTTGCLWNYYRDEPSDSLSSKSESLHTRKV